ncbi:NAD(P)-dependent alcohol dehydrogenase [Candidatus Bathyarchaeota archaeon]|nr:MAG: NAD(P)-dependent alcohol dehydrogenase [Candidatus Bathyarchaeota archaeon]
MEIPAYGATAAKAPLEPLKIERRKPGPHDVEIEILYCGICHSDVHKVNDDWGGTHFPVVPGHEIVGRVASRGTSATRFREGELVGVGCLVDSCRVCPECRAGREMFCEKGVTFTFDSFDRNTKTWTYGGYSTDIVVDERYVLRVPNGLDPVRAAPLMCAGITTYSPLHQFGCNASMRADVTVLSTSRDKEKDASRLGAKHFVATKELGALEALEGRFSLIMDTVSAPHDLNKQLTLLRSFGTMVLVGLPPSGAQLDAFTLVHGNRRIAGSNIGGVAETQEMLDYCGKNGIVADVEVIKADQINDAYKRMERGDVRYRFVIDAASLRA